jgi:hypothetical protein
MLALILGLCSVSRERYVIDVRPGVEQAGGKQQGNKDWVHKSENLWAEWRPWGKSSRAALQRVMVPAH